MVAYLLVLIIIITGTAVINSSLPFPSGGISTMHFRTGPLFQELQSDRCVHAPLHMCAGWKLLFMPMPWEDGWPGLLGVNVGINGSDTW